MATATGTISQEGERLLNRELSWLEFNARVLELAADASVPLLERVKFCSIFSVEPGRVLHGPRRRAHGPGGGGRSPCARPTGGLPSTTLAAIRERTLALTARQSRLWSRELVPALKEAGIDIAQVDECSEKELAELERALRPRDLSGADAARGGAGAAVPVHLRPLEQPRRARARSRERGGALCAREGARGAPALPRGGQARCVRPARGRDRALPRLALPADGGRRARGLPCHPGRRLRGLGRGRRPARGRRARAQAPPLRRRRPPRGLRLRVEPAPRPPDRGARRERGPGVPDPRPARPRRPLAARGPRPARPEGRAVGPEHAGAARRGPRRRGVLRRDPARRRPRPPSLRLLRDHLRALRARGGARPGRDHAEDDRVPHERRLAGRACADRGGRGRAPERLPRGAEGALRRAPEHRVVARAGARGRPRRLRLPQPQDPREDDPDHPARGEPAAPLPPHRHRQLPRAHGADLRGLRPLHRRRGHRRGRRRPLQLRHRLRSPAGVSQAPGGAVQPPSPARRGDPQGGQGGRRRRARAHPPEDERAHRPDDHRGALRRLAGRRRDRHRRALHLPAPPGRRRAVRLDPRPQHPRPLSRAQPLLHLRGRRGRPPRSWAAPT